MQLTTSKTRRLSATLTVAVGGALTLAGAHAAADTARRCAPHTNERIVARGPSTLLLLRTVQETETTLRRLQLCSASTGRRRTLDRAQEDPSGGTARFAGYRVRGRVTSWLRVEGESPVRSTLIVARDGRKLSEFAAPTFVANSVPNAASIVRVAITARGFAAFITRAPSVSDVLHLVDPSGAARELDQGASGAINAVRWTAPNTVRWRTSNVPRSARVSR